MRNLIAERLIQSGNFFFPCRHARDGCRFEAARERLGAHERGCPARPVPCPDGGAAACGREGGTVPLNQVGRVGCIEVKTSCISDLYAFGIISSIYLAG